MGAGRSLHARLLDRREEIRTAILTRVYAVSDPAEVADSAYVDGLRAAVDAAIDYALASIDASARNPPQIPPVLLVQARIAARDGIGLDTVLRRYVAGYTLLGDLLIEEAEAGDIDAASLKILRGTMASRFDQLLVAVSEEHARESERCPKTSEEHRAELVEGLLAGERLDASELAYDPEASHLGLLARGPGATEAIRELATLLDRSLLLIRHEGETVWAWLGGRRPLFDDALRRAVADLPAGVFLAAGQPGEGIEGWRLTHRQAKAALPIAMRGPGPFVCYADVALLAAISRDDLLATSLRQIYLEPLSRERDGGRTSSETLRAYFASGRSIASTAAALGVNRNTVASRLRAVEEALGRPLEACGAEVDVALRLEELEPAGTGTAT